MVVNTIAIHLYILTVSLLYRSSDMFDYMLQLFIQYTTELNKTSEAV